MPHSNGRRMGCGPERNYCIQAGPWVASGTGRPDPPLRNRHHTALATDDGCHAVEASTCLGNPGRMGIVIVPGGYQSGADQLIATEQRWHSLALRSDGTVVAWGDNTFGQTNVPPGLRSLAAIAAGRTHSLALTS